MPVSWSLDLYRFEVGEYSVLLVLESRLTRVSKISTPLPPKLVVEAAAHEFSV